MRTVPSTVFVVDDDPAVRESLHWLIESVGLAVKTYGTANEFLEQYNPNIQGCLVLDVRMPGLSGLDLQERLTSKHIEIPTIVITGHADVPMAIRAIKAGALDFIEKPFNDQVLLERIGQALALDAKIRQNQSELAEIAGRLESLTSREREVMQMVVDGKPNKIIADRLGVSQKTVEVHRASVMKKMQVDSLAELVRLVLAQQRAR
jgi:two-component system, LuxR family, response regulator FixJ